MCARSRFQGADLKRFLAFALFLLTAIAFAGEGGTIKITLYPTASVADARSTVTVTAEVRDSGGKPAPDGTQVVFAATLGTFRDTVVTAYGGLARGILVAGGIPGTSHITISAPALNSVSTADLEFLSDRSLLSSAQEYIEVVSPSYLMMAVDTKILAASQPHKGASLRYRDLKIDADEIQLDCQANTFKAAHAHLKFGKSQGEFDHLFFDLNTRKGFGMTTLESSFQEFELDGLFLKVAPRKQRTYAIAEVRASGMERMQGAFDASQLELADITSGTLISSKKAVVFPHKLVQFHRAALLVDGQKVLRFPLYEWNMNGNGELITDQIVNVNDTKVAVNYPHYLTLAPGQTSVLRFRTGEALGRSGSTNSGAYLDYELNWNRGDQMDGGFTFSGVGRSDYGLNLHQNIRFDDRSSAFATIDSPAMKSLFGSVGYTRQLNGYQLSLNGSSSRSLTGIAFDSQNVTLGLDKDPIKYRGAPIQAFLGVSAGVSSNASDGVGTSQTAIGLHLRNQLLPQKLGHGSTLNSSLTFSNLYGHNTQKGLTVSSSTFVNKIFSSSASLQVGYDYNSDVFSSSLLGHHRMNMIGALGSKRIETELVASKSLDADHLDYEADAHYKISPLWRMGYRYTFEQFNGSRFADYNALLTYRIGVRDVGLNWSTQTHRLGLTILGATFR